MTNKSRNIKVKSADEPWNFITLVDGTILKTRHIVIAVLQVLNEDGSPVVDNAGATSYMIAHNMIVAIESSPMIEVHDVTSYPDNIDITSKTRRKAN